jgi:sugar/nucleoside kinase (ribokinase family)
MRFPFDILASAEFDAVGFGSNAVDYLIRVPEYPGYNSKVELTSYSRSAGGEVASTLAGLSRLGLKTLYCGRFGDDAEGIMGRQSLIDEGVDTTYAETVEGARTQIAFILIDDVSGERTVIWHRDNRLAYGTGDPPLEIARLGRALHMTPHDPQACIKLASAARSNGVIVSIDVDRPFDGIAELLPLVDVCISSADLPQRLFGIDEPGTAVKELNKRYGCPVTGVTLGEAGSIILCNDSLIVANGFPVPGGCTDTTGAGDAYRTGFLNGMLNGRSVEESSRLANAVAALKCRAYGARAGLPVTAELASVMKNT